MMKSILFCLLTAMLLTTVPAANAQQAGKVPRIGFLDNSTASSSAVLLEAFRQELSKLGWIEGKDIAIARVLEDRYGINLAAIVVATGQARRLAYINEFVEEAKASGLVQRAIEHAGLHGVASPTPKN